MLKIASIVLLAFVWTQPASTLAQSDSDERKPGFGYGIRLGEVRTYTGVDNHREDLGAAGLPLLRVSWSDYPDGIGEELREGANPRAVSNLVVDQGGISIPSGSGLTDATWAWGQFIDHDLDLTDSHPDNGTADIPVLDMFDPLHPTIFFNRANHLVIDGVREQFNEVTSFLDASQVYGSDDFRAGYLRTMSRGLMKTSPGDLLPLNVDGLPNLGDDPELFLGGDIRVNENVVLTSMHTLFVREHNRLARRIAGLAPRATDEEIYQLARKIVNAEIQIITYREFLPALLGPKAPRDWSWRYRPRVDPTIANEFSGSLFRVGHTLLSSDLVIGETGKTIALKDAFTNPDFIKDDPQRIGHMLLGLSRQRCQEIDSMIVEDVRTFLFLPPPFPLGLDLAALNMQRGRDHGLPTYNEVRQAYGLWPVTDFDGITSDLDTQAALRAAYGTVDEIDPWVGGICEDHVPDGNVGQLIFVALHDQFTRSRDGDRFFYSRDRDLWQPLVRRVINLNRVTFSQVIRRNTGMNAPRDMFFFRK
ncbi:MAG: peroxidase family protein [Pirellulaceae bacterium]